MIIALATFLSYYICSGKNEKSKKSTALLSGTDIDSMNQSGSDEDVSDVSAEDQEGKKKDSAEHARENTLSFKFNSESKTYNLKAVKAFIKVQISGELNGYVANFVDNIESLDMYKPETYSDVFSFMIPPDGGTGTFKETSENFIVQFFGSDKGIKYILDSKYSFTMTITEWGGPGGRAKGSFQGDLKAEDGSVTVTIRDGLFDIAIQ